MGTFQKAGKEVHELHFDLYLPKTLILAAGKHRIFEMIDLRPRGTMKSGLLRIVILAWCLLCGTSAFGAIVHLKSGESLSGRIQKMDEQTLSLESDRGFGILQIERSDIRLIEFDGYVPDMGRKFGLGIYRRSLVLNYEGNSQTYDTGVMSIKSWINNMDSFEVLIGYAATRDDNQQLLSVFTMEPRFSRVFLQEGNQQLFWTLGVKRLDVTDHAADIDTSGWEFNSALGVELFPITLPNVGIAVELGASHQAIAGRNSNHVGLPAVVLRYYF